MANETNTCIYMYIDTTIVNQTEVSTSYFTEGMLSPNIRHLTKYKTDTFNTLSNKLKVIYKVISLWETVTKTAVLPEYYKPTNPCLHP